MANPTGSSNVSSSNTTSQTRGTKLGDTYGGNYVDENAKPKSPSQVFATNDGNIDESYGSNGSEYSEIKNNFITSGRTQFYGHNGKSFADGHKYRNGSYCIDDPVFTGFTMSIDTLNSPLFYTIGSYDGVVSNRQWERENPDGTITGTNYLARNISDEIENCLRLTYGGKILTTNNVYEINAMLSKDPSPNGTKIGYGNQKNVYGDGLVYGATEYIYLVDKEISGTKQNSDKKGSQLLGDGHDREKTASAASLTSSKNQMQSNIDSAKQGTAEAKKQMESSEKKHKENETKANEDQKKFTEAYYGCTINDKGQYVDSNGVVVSDPKPKEDVLTDEINKLKETIDILRSPEKYLEDIYNKEIKEHLQVLVEPLENLSKYKQKVEEGEFKYLLTEASRWDVTSAKDDELASATASFNSGYSNYLNDKKAYKNSSETSSELKTEADRVFQPVITAINTISSDAYLSDLFKPSFEPPASMGSTKGTKITKEVELAGEKYNLTFTMKSTYSNNVDSDDLNVAFGWSRLKACGGISDQGFAYYMKFLGDGMSALEGTRDTRITLSGMSGKDADVLKKRLSNAEKELTKKQDELKALRKNLYGSESGSSDMKSPGGLAGTANASQENLNTDDYSNAEIEKEQQLMAQEEYENNLDLIDAQLDALEAGVGYGADVEANSQYKSGADVEAKTDDISRQNPDKHEVPDAPQTVYDILGFIAGMKNLTRNYPYIMQSVTGLDEAYKKHYVVNDPYLGSGDDKITINCYESVDLRVSSMFNRYFNAVYDRQYRRERVPVNLRRFNCSIFVHDIRDFKKNLSTIGGNLSGKNSSSVLANIAFHSLSAVEFKFYDCEIVPEETGSIFDNVSNADMGDMRMTNFTFKYGNCVINFLPFADLQRHFSVGSSYTPSRVNATIPSSKSNSDLRIQNKGKNYLTKLNNDNFVDSLPTLDNTYSTTETKNVYKNKNTHMNNNDEVVEQTISSMSSENPQLLGLDKSTTVPAGVELSKLKVSPDKYILGGTGNGDVNIQLESGLGNVNDNDDKEAAGKSYKSDDNQSATSTKGIGHNESYSDRPYDTIGGLGNVNDNDYEEDIDYINKGYTQTDSIIEIGDVYAGIADEERGHDAFVEKRDRQYSQGYNYPQYYSIYRKLYNTEYEAENQARNSVMETMNEQAYYMMQHIATSISASTGIPAQNVYDAMDLKMITQAMNLSKPVKEIEDIIPDDKSKPDVSDLGTVYGKLKTRPDIKQLGDVIPDDRSLANVRQIGDVIPDDKVNSNNTYIGNVYPNGTTPKIIDEIDDVIPDEKLKQPLDEIGNVYPQLNQTNDIQYIDDVIPDEKLNDNIGEIGNIYPTQKDTLSIKEIGDVYPQVKQGTPIDELGDVIDDVKENDNIEWIDDIQEDEDLKSKIESLGNLY